jgi:hypothetical protein
MIENPTAMLINDRIGNICSVAAANRIHTTKKSLTTVRSKRIGRGLPFVALLFSTTAPSDGSACFCICNT